MCRGTYPSPRHPREAKVASESIVHCVRIATILVGVLQALPWRLPVPCIDFLLRSPFILLSVQSLTHFAHKQHFPLQKNMASTKWSTN